MLELTLQNQAFIFVLFNNTIGRALGSIPLEKKLGKDQYLENIKAFNHICLSISLDTSNSFTLMLPGYQHNTFIWHKFTNNSHTFQ